MAWPSTTQYNEAIQNLRTAVSDEELRAGELARTSLGLPMLWTGNFADVYKVDCPATGNTWAVKCFTRASPGLKDRYREISAHLNWARLPFTVDFQFVEPGIRIWGEWHPFLKMRWVEGSALNQFVADYVENRRTLKLLLPMWVKLSQMLRKADIAHCDLQHGNVLLVPAGEGGQLGLKLIDYDGMYVPSLSGRRSAELGHPSYQHPQRLREGLFGPEVDRFSHLAIYCGIRCLITGGRALWDRFNNGENLLFREVDHKDPGASEVFQHLWSVRNPDVHALVGRVILATQMPLDRVPLLEQVASNGSAVPLSGEEEGEVAAVLERGAAAAVPSEPAESDSGREGPWWSSGPAGLEAGLPAPVPTAGASGPAALAGEAVPEWAKPGGVVEAFPGSAMQTLYTPVRGIDRLLGRMAGEGNAIIHGFLRLVAVALVAVALTLLIGLTVWITAPRPGTGSTVGPLHLRPISPQTVEVGSPVTVAVSVENGEHWERKVTYSLGPQAPAGAHIDPNTGTFTWTPTEKQRPGTYHVTVSVAGPESQKDEKSFAITVTPILLFKPIADQSIKLGKTLTTAVSVENAQHWEGKVTYSLGPQAPAGARIDPNTGSFAWTPGQQHHPGTYDVTVSATGPEGQSDQMSFRITVTRRTPTGEKEITVDLGSGVTMEMVLIPAGQFVMGSPDSDQDADSDEKPQHQVRITQPFYLGKYEVTQEQWQAVMGNNPSRFKGPKNPVENVSWDDCQAFLTKLNEKYAGTGVRFSLPTEAQWEYACRAGSTTRWCFGDGEATLGEYAWYSRNSINRTHPVGQKRPNAWRLYDMHGNVWEWCADWHDSGYYGTSPLNGPVGPSSGSYRVVRGGSWINNPGNTRSADRDWFTPDVRYDISGFRVSRTP